jgi:signal transduction histidine kinase
VTRFGRLRSRSNELASRVAKLDVSLLLKLLGGFVLALTLASIVTLLLENRLTRDELQEQADELLRSHLSIVAEVSGERSELVAQNLRSTGEILETDRAGTVADRGRMDQLLTELSRSWALGVVNAFHESGELVGVAPGPVVRPPPVAAMEQLSRSGGNRVVSTHEGGYARVAWVVLGRAPDRIVLVAGDPLDAADASRVRFAPGTAHTVLLIVDGQVVGSTDPALSGAPAPAATAEDGGLEVVDLHGTATFVRYATLARATDGWAHDAAVGIAVPEPLGSIDQRLLRTRVLMIVILIGTAAVLAWAMTRVVTRPLLGLTETASAIAAGDLDASFAAQSNDEIGILAGALERMRHVLRAQLHVIRRQAGLVQDGARRVVSARDAERGRLARDLHDGIQQQLVMLRLQVGFARGRMEQRPEEIRPATDELAAEIDRIIERVRETSLDIFPAILQDRGLQGALFSLAGRSSVPVSLQTQPDPLPRFPPDLEANAYFLISEAVTNALKHADARRIEVAAHLRSGVLRVTVDDDGVGFDVTTVGDTTGLHHLHDRVNAVGGAVRIRSRPGRGTRVAATMPVSVVAGPLEEEQHGGHPAVDVDVLGEPEPPEDRVGVFLDRPFRDEQGPGDGGVAFP